MSDRALAVFEQLPAHQEGDLIGSMQVPQYWTGITSNNTPWQVVHNDARNALEALPEEYYHCIITSPPYFWQRDYGASEQIGLEPHISDYVEAIANTMDAAKRVLRKDGVLFLNLGDTYYSMKGQPKGVDRKNRGRRFGLRAVDVKGLGVPKKTAIGIPWRVALEMIGRGWILRSPIIWRRKRPIPEPNARDRPWRSYEFIFMFSRSTRYYFSRESLGSEEDIWTIASQSKVGNHPAVFPEELVQRCLDIGCPNKGRVLDPFVGSGTVMRVALTMGLESTGIDINGEFCRKLAFDLQHK